MRKTSIDPRFIASILLAAGVDEGAFAKDIRGLQSVTLGAQNFYIDTPSWPNGDRSASAQASYDGAQPFEGLSVGPDPDLSGACDVWGCDRTGADVTPGRVSAWMWQVSDAGGALASAEIRYRSGGTHGMLLTIEQLHVGGDFGIRLEDESWTWSGRTQEVVPPGADLVIDAYTSFNEGGSTDIQFSVTPLEGDPPPIVSRAFVYADAYCLIMEPQSDSASDSVTIAPSDLGCGESASANTSSSSASFRHRGLAPSEGPWTAELRLSAAGVITSGCNDSSGRSEALLVLTEPLTLSGLEDSGGILTLDGSVVSASDFPITLPPGTHGFEFRSPGDQAVSAAIQIETTTDPDAFADCNANGIADGCDILVGDLADIDRNWLPDTCQRARGDLTVDGIIDAADLTVVLAAWGTNNPDADLNDDGLVGAVDIAELLSRWGPLE